MKLRLDSPIFRAVLFPLYSSSSCPTRGSQRSRRGGRSLPGKLFSHAGHEQEADMLGKREHVKPVLVPRFLPLLRIFSSTIYFAASTISFLPLPCLFLPLLCLFMPLHRLFLLCVLYHFFHLFRAVVRIRIKLFNTQTNNLKFSETFGTANLMTRVVALHDTPTI